MPPMPDLPRLRPLGDGSWIVEFGHAIDEATHERVMGFAQALAAARAAGELAGVREWVPAYTTVAVHFDADGAADAAGAAAPRLLELARAAVPLHQPGRRWRLPVCFDADLAPDLAAVAAARALEPAQVVALLTATPFRVHMLGFQPGFPYLGGLPAALELPRRANPRTDVPERSLAIAGRMCAVYPWRSPGGWHLVGRTPIELFDARLADPAWLRPGDEVRWQAIDRAEYEALVGRAAAGTLARDEWLADGGVA